MRLNSVWLDLRVVLVFKRGDPHGLSKKVFAQHGWPGAKRDKVLQIPLKSVKVYFSDGGEAPRHL